MLRSWLNLFAAAVLTLLGACTITSPTQLVGPDEGATPLPESFVVYGYKQGEDNAYAPTAEAPMPFARNGKTYVAGDNSMSLRFVGLGDNGYLLSVTGNEAGALYGTAWVRDGIMVILMMLTDKTEDAAEKARSASPPELAADISVVDGALTVTRRDTLDHLVGLMREGVVPAEPLVAWIAEDAEAPTPRRIVRDGDAWKAE